MRKSIVSYMLVGLTFATTNVFGQVLGKKAIQFEYNGKKHVFESDYRTSDLPQQEVTSKLHGENVGKILFSSEKIQFKKEDPSKIKSTFTTSENIYARAYMICSAANDTLRQSGETAFYKTKMDEIRKANKIDVILVDRGSESSRRAEAFCNVYVDGRLTNWQIERINFSDESLHHTTRQIWIAPKLEDEKVSDTWLEILDGLSDGEHTVRVELIGMSGSYESYRPLAEGEFTLIKDGGSVATGLKFADLNEGRVDANLSNEIVGILKNTAKEKGWRGVFEKVKLRTDWEAQYVDSGRSIKKIREIRVYGYATYPDGKCTIEEFTVAQSHNGSEFSGPIFYRRVIPSTKQRIDCD